MKDKIKALIETLKAREDFEDEFYLTYIGKLNDGDISDWFNNHFDDNIELGSRVGATMATADIISELETILGSEA